MHKGQWIFLLILIPVIASAQIVINNFDGAATDGSIDWLQIEREPSFQEVRNDSTDKHEGEASFHEYVYFGPLNSWGTFAHTGSNFAAPEDWSESETLSVWIKVLSAPYFPDAFVFRMHLIDQPAGENTEEYVYENATVVDTETDWVELVVPFVERDGDGDLPPNDEGFAIMPASWGRATENNMILDKDQIVGFSLALVTGSVEEDEIELLFDYFTRSGTPNAVEDETENIGGFELSANFPNPFNPSTEISFSLQKAGNASLQVFNLMGQKVATLVDGFMAAGPHHIQFHAGNLPAGVYFYRLEAADFVSTRKMILMP